MLFGAFLYRYFIAPFCFCISCFSDSSSHLPYSPSVIYSEPRVQFTSRHGRRCQQMTQAPVVRSQRLCALAPVEMEARADAALISGTRAGDREQIPGIRRQQGHELLNVGSPNEEGDRDFTWVNTVRYRLRVLRRVDAGLMEDRAEALRLTEASRHLALMADGELRRRHPGANLEPLRTAEPVPAPDELPTVTDEQAAADHTAAAAARRAAVRAAIEERQNVGIPARVDGSCDVPVCIAAQRLRQRQRLGIRQPGRDVLRPAVAQRERQPQRP